MMLRSGRHQKALMAGFSVAIIGLMTGLAQAQDAGLTDPPEVIDEELILIAGPVIEDGVIEDGVIGDGVVGEEYPDLYVIDPIVIDDGEVFVTDVEIYEGEPINTDGIGDGEPLPDVVIDDEMGGVVGEEPLVTEGEFPQSTCDGCEYQTMAGGPEVQRDVTIAGPAVVQRSDSNDSLDPGPGVVSDENNICYNADLYIPLLCDWQRPFVGDRMP